MVRSRHRYSSNDKREFPEKVNNGDNNDTDLETIEAEG